MRAHTLALLASVALTGCPDRTLSALPNAQDHVEVKTFPANPRRDLDILFLIDNSGSMSQEQASLKANFARFMGVLEQAQGGLPNVHIAVATSDLGTSAADGTADGTKFGCAGNGDAGVLRPLASGARWISDVDDGHGGRTRNYSGALADAFTEIANVGTGGCGIEQHLGSMAAALDPANPANAGFVRPGSLLAIVIIADEDDCSLARAGLFDGTSDAIDVNFRCTDDGVACDSPSTAFDAAIGPRQQCHPNAHARWTQDPLHYANLVKQLKPNADDVLVAGILGPTDKFSIVKDGGNHTTLDWSCTYPSADPTKPQTAFPAVRTSTFLHAFPQHFTERTICDPDLSPALLAISQAITDHLGTRCFDSTPADVDPRDDGAQYDCSVVETRATATGVEELAVLPPCAHNPSNTACWQVVTDTTNCPNTASQLALDIQWHDVPHDDTIGIKADCVTVDGTGGYQ